MAKVVHTPAGTALPLLNLKGKDYMMVAHRIQWFNEVEKFFDIKTEFLLIDEDQTICRATVSVKDSDGKILRSVTATKRETKKDFPDHTEKSETSCIGRAITLLGYGTQFALADLDEGMRLADSPVVDAKEYTVKTKTNEVTSAEVQLSIISAEAVKAISSEPVATKPVTSSFKRTPKPVEQPVVKDTSDKEWQ